MMKTVEAVVDESGRVRLLEEVKLRTAGRALVTILGAPPPERVAATALPQPGGAGRGLGPAGRGWSVVTSASGAV